MMVTRPLRLLIAGIVMVAACGCGPDSTEIPSGLVDPVIGTRGTSGTYLYAGYDSSGREIVRGEIAVAIDDSGDVTGSWNLNSVVDPPPEMIGPQVGRGKLTGRVDGTMISLGLNPDMADNNVFLTGTIVGDRITGVWEYVGFPGVLNGGTFAAALTHRTMCHGPVPKAPMFAIF